MKNWIVTGSSRDSVWVIVGVGRLFEENEKFNWRNEPRITIWNTCIYIFDIANRIESKLMVFIPACKPRVVRVSAKGIINRASIVKKPSVERKKLNLCLHCDLSFSLKPNTIKPFFELISLFCLKNIWRIVRLESRRNYGVEHAAITWET